MGEEGVFGEAFVVESGVVFDHASGVVEADRVGQFAGVVERVADREQGSGRVEVDRGGVETGLGIGGEGVESDDAPDGQEQARLEFDAHPGTPGSDGDDQTGGLARGLDDQVAVGGVGTDLERDGEVGAVLRVAGTGQVSEVGAVGLGVKEGQLLAFAGSVVGVGREEGWGAEAAAEVRDAHAGEDPARGGVGRVGAGAAKDRGGNAGLVEDVPDRGSAAEVDGLGGSEGVFLLVLVEGQVGQVRLGVAAEEVEDTVAAGVEAGGEGRPSDGGLSGGGGGEARQAPLVAEPGEVGQFSPIEQAGED